VTWRSPIRARKYSVAAFPAAHPSAHDWPDPGASIPQKAIGHAIDLERIAINHANGVGKGGRRCKRDDSCQG
jgi:hypothetical protein